MTEPVRVALVGCGAIARHHLRALSSVTDARCTVLFDARPDQADEARTRHRLDAVVAGDLEEVASLADCAIVAVPTGFHAEVAVDLLDAGLHVLCEKPLAPSVADARDMEAHAARAGRVLACGLVRRFMPFTALAADALQSSIVGKPVRCSAQETAWTWPFSRSTFDRDASGGGVLVDQGSHVFDLITHLLGPITIEAYEDDAAGGVEAHASVRATTTGSPLVPIEVRLSRNTKAPTRLRIECSGGEIVVDGRRWGEIAVRFTGSDLPYTTTAAGEPRDPFALQLKNFVDAVRGREPLRVPLSDGIRGVELIEECYARRRASDEPWHRPAGRIRLGSAGAGRTLVTGATGAIGSRLVEVAAANGELDRLRCMVRSYRSAARIMRFTPEIVEADLDDRRSIDRAVSGCQAIVHLALGSHPARETRSLAEAAQRAGVRRFVHISSAAVYGRALPTSIEELQEGTPMARTGEPYADGKAAAERALSRCAARGLPTVVLRPPIVYGPGTQWSPEIIDGLHAGALPVVLDGGWCNLVYVDDLVSAIGRALSEDSALGETVFVTDGSPIPWNDFILRHARLAGVTPPTITVAEAQATSTGSTRGGLAAAISVLRTREFRELVLGNSLSRAMVVPALRAAQRWGPTRERFERLRESSGGPSARRSWSPRWLELQQSQARLSSDRASEALGFTAAVDLDEGLRRTELWLREYGYLEA